MNNFENKIAESLEGAGWMVLRDGWPDFLCYREAEDGKREVVCVEVKNPNTGDIVRRCQQAVHEILVAAGIPVYVAHSSVISQMGYRNTNWPAE